MAAPSQEYLKTKVLTASPEMLTLMLWDGAIRFAEQGKDAILKKDIEGSYKVLLRSQRIITELITNLRHEVDPDLCGKLSAIYNFIYRRLVEANIDKNASLVDDALEIMRHQRETWVMLMEKLTEQRAAEAGQMQATVAANADALAAGDSLPIRPAPVPAPAAVPVPAAASPARRAYPGFAARPLQPAASLSVQG